MTITSFPIPASRSATRTATLKVTDLARRAEVTPATVRYYARIGLLNPGRDARNGYRRFSSSDLRRMTFIRKAQALGLTIGDIRTILDRLEHGEAVCELVTRTIEGRLEEVRSQIDELHATESRMVRALTQWQRPPGQAREGDALCPLIEGVEDTGDVAGPGLAAVAGARLSRP